jgi:tetratricopeptide (TPR) repeat protein
MTPPAQAQSAQTSAPPRSLLDRPYVLPAFACGLTFLLYIGALRFGFVYDDRIQILDNPMLRSWSSLPSYFTSHVWAFDPSLPANYWRPLFLLWLLINRTLFGYAPLGWHFTALALHVAVTGLVYALARKLTADRLTAALAALIFGVHPVLIETVAWVSGATDSMLALFLLPAFLLYLAARPPGARRSQRMAASLAFFAASLLVKETAVVLPLLVFAYAWIRPDADTPRATRLRTALAATAPYLAVTAAYLVARAFVLHGLGHDQNQASLLTLLLTWPSLLWLYLRLLLLPYGMSAYYDLKLVNAVDFRHVLLPGLAVAAAAAAFALGLRWLRSHREEPGSSPALTPRLAAFLGAWILLPILPVLYLRPLPPEDFAHARYLYLSCMGFAILMATGLRRLPASRRKLFGSPASQVAVALLIVVALAASNAFQQLYWADNLLLYARGVTVAPHNPRALTNMGVELGMRGRYQQAVPFFLRALALKPDFWFANFNLGYTYLRMSDYRQADRYLRTATRLQPNSAQQYAYLGTAQMWLGKLDEAAQSMREAIRINPQGRRYHYALGVILEKQGDRSAAAAAFRAEVAQNPEDAEARAHLQALQNGK